MGLSEFQEKIAELGLKMEAEYRGEELKFGGQMDAWSVTLSTAIRPQNSFSIPFYTGLGNRQLFVGPGRATKRSAAGKPATPSIEDVVDCILSDSTSAGETFAEWCSNFGYDADSRQHLETYLKCQENGASLRALIGYDNVNALQQCER